MHEIKIQLKNKNGGKITIDGNEVLCTSVVINHDVNHDRPTVTFTVSASKITHEYEG